MEATREGGKRVLVVDDDRDIREMLSIALELGGFRVSTAGNGADALRQLRESSDFGIVLLDLMMPGMNGWEFRAEQQGDPAIASVPVVVLSGDGNIVQKTVAIGASGYVKKPIDLDQLFETVARHVGGEPTGKQE